MSRRPSSPVLGDLERFVAIGDRLHQSPPFSLNRIAAELRISAPAVRDCVRRVEAHLGGVRLVHTAEGVGAATFLTPDGERYLEAARRLVQWRPLATNELRLTLSHTLLTCRLVTRDLAAFQRETQLRVQLRAETLQMNFDRVVQDLQTGHIDIAMVWGTKERIESNYTAVDVRMLKVAFDVVLVSRNPSDLDGPVDDLSRLASRRVVSLRPENQPLAELLPEPDPPAGGERIVADTIDAVISHLLAGVGEVGLIVADYGVLDPLLVSGLLYYSPPLGRTPLLCLSARGVRRSAESFASFIEDRLLVTPNESTDRRGAKAFTFPEEPAFYEAFSFAYYIDHRRGTLDDGHRHPPRWHWETVHLDRHGRRVGDFTGSIRNGLGDEFTATARRVGPRLFHVCADLVADVGPQASVLEFVSIFVWCDRDRGIMYGHWSGEEPRKGQPVLYPTFWSHDRLDLSDLRRLAHEVRLRTVLDVEDGADFDKHP